MNRRIARLGRLVHVRAAFLLGALVGMTGSSCSCDGSPGDGSTDDGSDRAEVAADDVPGPDTEAGDDATSDMGPDIEPDDDAPADADAESTDGDGDGDVGDREDMGADADDTEVPDDGGTGLPTGCWYARPTTDVAFAWRSRYSIDDGKFVWRWIDSSSLPSEGVLVVRDLATHTDREVLRRAYPDKVELPSVHSGTVHFSSPTVAEDSYSSEIFGIEAAGGPETRITHNSNADGFQVSGDGFVVYRSEGRGADGGRIWEYRYYDLTDGSEHLIAPIPGVSEIAFDGHRWVAYTGADNHGIYKFDLLDPGAGPRPIGPDGILSEGLAFDRDTGTLIITTYREPRSDDWGLEAWDMATETMADLLDDAWSEVGPDVDGRIVVYLDSEAAGETFWAHRRSDVRIVDRDTGAVRVVLPLDTYYGVGIWERWIAVNNYGLWGDSLITCDLVEGGFMSDDLHVLPE